MVRGVDGLTVEELRSSRDFWDAHYTRELLDAIPTSARTLVDIGCGLARTACELLPRRPALKYIGIDLDQERLTAAANAVSAAALAARTRLVSGAAERLPLADGVADVALTAMVLQHIADPGAVVTEMHRILAPDGVLVAVEPDYAPQTFYFDGPVEPVNAAVRSLRAEHNKTKRPVDHNIGPKVAGLARARGFRDVCSRVHCLQGSGYTSASHVAAEILEMTHILAASLPRASQQYVRRCRQTVQEWLDQVGNDAMGQYLWFVPVFVTRGRR